jgi:hypothetical protein
MAAFGFAVGRYCRYANDGLVLDTGLSHCSKYRQFKPPAAAPSTTAPVL